MALTPVNVRRYHVFTRDLDGSGLYLDPRKPISRAHIDAAAKRAKVAPNDIDVVVRALSVHLGWDIERGSDAVMRTNAPRRRRARIRRGSKRTR